MTMSRGVSVEVPETHARRDGEVEQPPIEHRPVITGVVATGVVRQNPTYHGHTSVAGALQHKHHNGVPEKKFLDCSKQKEVFPDSLYQVSGRLKGTKKEPTTNTALSKGEDTEAAEPQKPAVFDFLVPNDNCNEKRSASEYHGIYGKHALGGAKEFARRTSGAYSLFEQLLITTPEVKKKRGSRHNIASVPATRHSSQTCLFSAGACTIFTPAATSKTSSVRVKGKAAARSRIKKDGVNMAAPRGAILRMRSVSVPPVSPSLRVVHQTDPIKRGKTREAFSVSAEKKLFSRVIDADDLLWKREREGRQSLFNGGDTVVRAFDIFQVVTGRHSLPTVLVSAIVERHLALLMRCPRSEVERVVSMLTSSGFFDVMRYLRQAYGRGCFASSHSATCKVYRAHSCQKEESLVACQRYLRNVSAVTGRNDPLVDTKGGVANLPRNVRHFMNSFAQEACMAFLDECCSLCRACVSTEEFVDGVGNGEPLSQRNMTSLYGHVVTELLFQMLGWTKEESSRVVPVVVRLVMQHLPLCSFAFLDS